MDKAEILKKAQNEKDDELEIQVRYKSLMYSYVVMVIAAVFSFILSKYGQPMLDLIATVSFSLFVCNAYRFVKTKEKIYLCLGLVMFGIAIVRFMIGY